MSRSRLARPLPDVLVPTTTAYRANTEYLAGPVDVNSGWFEVVTGYSLSVDAVKWASNIFSGIRRLTSGRVAQFDQRLEELDQMRDLCPDVRRRQVGLVRKHGVPSRSWVSHQ